MKLKVDNFTIELNKLNSKKNKLTRVFLPDNSTKIQELEKSINNTKKEMWNTLGISYWSEILYYHFENE